MALQTGKCARRLGINAVRHGMSLLQNFGEEHRSQLQLHRALHACIGLIQRLRWGSRLPSRRAEIDDYRRLARICWRLAAQSTMPEQRAAMLIMAKRYRNAARALA